MRLTRIVALSAALLGLLVPAATAARPATQAEKRAITQAVLRDDSRRHPSEDPDQANPCDVRSPLRHRARALRLRERGPEARVRGRGPAAGLRRSARTHGQRRVSVGDGLVRNLRRRLRGRAAGLPARPDGRQDALPGLAVRELVVGAGPVRPDRRPFQGARTVLGGTGPAPTVPRSLPPPRPPTGSGRPVPGGSRPADRRRGSAPPCRARVVGRPATDAPRSARGSSPRRQGASPRSARGRGSGRSPRRPRRASTSRS